MAYHWPHAWVCTCICLFFQATWTHEKDFNLSLAVSISFLSRPVSDITPHPTLPLGKMATVFNLNKEMGGKSAGTHLQ